MGTIKIKSGGRLMKRVGIAAILLAALVMQVGAQQRTLDDRTPGQIIRAWPQTGVWQVALGVSLDRQLACAMLTGREDVNSGELYLWGFRQKGTAFFLMVTDKNKFALSGDTIKVVIDATPIGTFEIGERLEENGVHNVKAEVPALTANALSRLLRIGGSVKLATDSATYSASLEGTAQGMEYLTTCAQEANELNVLGAAQNSPR